MNSLKAMSDLRWINGKLYYKNKYTGYGYNYYGKNGYGAYNRLGVDKYFSTEEDAKEYCIWMFSTFAFL